jgi:hypothetical protein
MYIIATQEPLPRILSVLKHPEVGEKIEVSSKFAWPVPEGVRVRVTPQSVVVPSTDPNSVVRQSFLGLLANHPQFSKIVWNPLLEGTDMDGLDLSFTLNEGGNSWPAKVQIGRGTGGPLPSGSARGSVALLPGTLTKPGALVSSTIDIGPLTGGLGANQFSLYWYIATYETTEDISSGYGVFVGRNQPSIRSLVETPQSRGDFAGFLSVDNGSTFLPAGRLQPISFCDKGTLLRVGFRNQGAEKIYLLGFAVLF